MNPRLFMLLRKPVSPEPDDKPRDAPEPEWPDVLDYVRATTRHLEPKK